MLLLSLAGAAGAAGAAPPLPSTPAGIQGLLYARAFTLNEGFTYLWRQERPTVQEGMLLVLQVDPALVYPRQTAEPVLYVGAQTAMRLNVGYPSGHVVALVPGGLQQNDMRIWFGTPRLPEAVTAGIIAEERALAIQRGIPYLRPDAMHAALQRGGAAFSVQNVQALLLEAANLVLRYAPDEGELAKNLASQAQGADDRNSVR